MTCRDDDNRTVRAGDTIWFSYGIPPVLTHAKIMQRGKSLIAVTEGHSPTECNLRSLRRHVGAWFKEGRR